LGDSSALRKHYKYYQRKGQPLEVSETKENYWNKWITIYKKPLKRIHNVNLRCLKRIHNVETSIVASGYGFKKHKPLKKSGTPLVKGPNVLQKKQ
jgi:hypothetical protein